MSNQESTILNRIKSLWKTIFSFFKRKEEYPNLITEANFKEWREKADELKKRPKHLVYSMTLVVPYFVLGLPILIAEFIFVVWLSDIVNFSATLTPEIHAVLFFFVLICLMVLTSFKVLNLLLLGIELYMKRFLGYPTDEEMIFAECMIVADYLRSGEKLKAKKEMRSQLNFYLSRFSRDFFNPRRKVYRPEFDAIRKGANASSRMLMFASHHIPDLFVDFGLALVRGEDRRAFCSIEKILANIREYGETRGRMQRLFDSIEKHPTLMKVIMWLTPLILSLILTLYQFLS